MNGTTKLFAILGIFAAIACQTAECQWSLDMCTRDVDVAIIGAGIGGAYSAYRLREAGLTVEMFEYSDRIGGRLFTSTLPSAPDLNIELGGMRYISGVNPLVENLIQELGLTPTPFPEGRGLPERTLFYLRGQALTAEQLASGDVPYNLSQEEVANADRIWAYWLEKLTGFNEPVIQREQLMKLKLLNGTELYKLSFDEAFDLAASPDGKNYARDYAVFNFALYNETNVVEVFDTALGELSPTVNPIMTLVEGMNAIPVRAVEEFLAASASHTITYNRRLIEIEGFQNPYAVMMIFQPTQTVDGVTSDMPNAPLEFVCPQRIIVAVPRYAQESIEWESFTTVTKQHNALLSLRPVDASKVFLAFPSAWWADGSANNSAYVMKSDLRFGQVYDWSRSNVSGEYLMIASYIDGVPSRFLHALSLAGPDAPGSVSGANRVSLPLQEYLLQELAEAFAIDRADIPEPTSSAAQFWTGYPFGGGWISPRSRYHYTEVRETSRRPAFIDDVYIVGSDFAYGHYVTWAEGALQTVEEVIDMYFTGP